MTMKTTFSLMLLGLSALAPVTPPLSSDGFAQTEQTENPMPFSTAGFQSGVIDEVQGSMIRIDGRTYVLKSMVMVVNHDGEPLELERIIPTSLAKFHLKEGHIDKMVVKRPQ